MTKSQTSESVPMADHTRAIPSSSETVRCHRCGSMRSAAGGICAECGASHEEWRQWRERGSVVWQALDRKMRAAIMGVVLAVSLWILSALAIAWLVTNRHGDVSDELGAVLLYGLCWATFLGALMCALRVDLALRAMPSWVIERSAWLGGFWIPAGALSIVALQFPSMLPGNGSTGFDVNVARIIVGLVSLAMSQAHWSQVRAIARWRLSGCESVDRASARFARGPLIVIGLTLTLGLTAIVLKEASVSWPPNLANVSPSAVLLRMGPWVALASVAVWLRVVILNARELRRWASRG
jgi:hypothetical protein